MSKTNYVALLRTELGMSFREIAKICGYTTPWNVKRMFDADGNLATGKVLTARNDRARIFYLRHTARRGTMMVEGPAHFLVQVEKELASLRNVKTTLEY